MKEAHPGTLNYLSVYQGSNALYFTTMCMDGYLKLWSSPDQEQEFIVKAELLFGRNLQEETSLLDVGEKHLMLLTGGYDSKIHVYCTQRGSAKSDLKYQFSMQGHFNSIKSI